MKSVQSTGKRSFRPVGRDLQASQPKAGWMRMASANKAIITGSDGSGNRRMKKGNASVPAVAEKTELTFVEIPCHTSAETNTYMVSDKSVATIRTATLQIDISNEISDALRFFRNYPYHSSFAYISFAAKSALLHLPYIVRFTIFNLLFVPSTKPFESSLATEFSTASISFSNPFANRDISFKSEFL